ncbi:MULTISPECIES: hypothetical protein [unclassified Rhodococcus (in: high G+C Gram-positive bacteria)]
MRGAVASGDRLRQMEGERMRFVTAGEFTAEQPWGAQLLASIDNATVRLH